MGRGATVGGSGAPIDTPGCGGPASGVPAPLPGPRSVLLDGLEGVAMGANQGLLTVDKISTETY